MDIPFFFERLQMDVHRGRGRKTKPYAYVAHGGSDACLFDGLRDEIKHGLLLLRDFLRVLRVLGGHDGSLNIEQTFEKTLTRTFVRFIIYPNKGSVQEFGGCGGQSERIYVCTGNFRFGNASPVSVES